MKHLIVLAVAVPSILIAFFSCTSMSTFTLPPVAMASTSIDTLTTADIFDPSKVTGLREGVPWHAELNPANGTAAELMIMLMHRLHRQCKRCSTSWTRQKLNYSTCYTARLSPLQYTVAATNLRQKDAKQR
jgi:hypothetical protein